MSDENKEKNSGKDRKTGDVKVPPRNWLIWTLILVAIPVVIFFRTNTEKNYSLVTRQQLEEWLASTDKIEGKIYYPPAAIIHAGGRDRPSHYHKYRCRSTPNNYLSDQNSPHREVLKKNCWPRASRKRNRTRSS